MNSKKNKTKLCWNCEGSTSFQDESCPYCGVSLSPLSIGEGVEQSLNPPYRLSNEDDDSKIPVSPFGETRPEGEEASNEDATLSNEQAIGALSEDNAKITTITMCFLLAGSMSLLFGFAQLLFSQNGVFSLQWSSHFWYIYLLIAIPLLFFGWNSLQKIKD